MADVEELVCSFREILGSQCGFHPKDRSRTVDVIPLLYCTRAIDGHKSALAFTGVENEVDLILSRSERQFFRHREILSSSTYVLAIGSRLV